MPAVVAQFGQLGTDFANLSLSIASVEPVKLTSFVKLEAIEGKPMLVVKPLLKEVSDLEQREALFTLLEVHSIILVTLQLKVGDEVHPIEVVVEPYFTKYEMTQEKEDKDIAVEEDNEVEGIEEDNDEEKDEVDDAEQEEDDKEDNDE